MVNQAIQEREQERAARVAQAENAEGAGVGGEVDDEEGIQDRNNEADEDEEREQGADAEHERAGVGGQEPQGESQAAEGEQFIDDALFGLLGNAEAEQAEIEAEVEDVDEGEFLL